MTHFRSEEPFEWQKPWRIHNWTLTWELLTEKMSSWAHLKEGNEPSEVTRPLSFVDGCSIVNKQALHFGVVQVETPEERLSRDNVVRLNGEGMSSR